MGRLQHWLSCGQAACAAIPRHSSDCARYPVCLCWVFALGCMQHILAHVECMGGRGSGGRARFLLNSHSLRHLLLHEFSSCRHIESRVFREFFDCRQALQSNIRG